MRQQHDRDVVERHGVDIATVERNLQLTITNAQLDRRLRKIKNPSLHFFALSFYSRTRSFFGNAQTHQSRRLRRKLPFLCVAFRLFFNDVHYNVSRFI